MSIKSSKYFCFVAFHAIEAHLAGMEPDPKIVNEIPDVELPLFVAYFVDNDQCGCRYHLLPINLRYAIPQFAVVATTHDHRFTPITNRAQLEKISMVVELLFDYEKVSNVFDWEIGKHGIVVEYMGQDSYMLPEVIAEQQWDQKYTLQKVLTMAGLREKFHDEMLQDITCTGFRARRRHEYLKMKGEM